MIKTPGIRDVKQFWNNRPCNVRHSDLPVGTREYFDEVESKKFRAEPHIPAFCEFDRWQGQRVLEIGAGIGTMAINFARAGADYTGVELSDVSLDLTRRRFEVYGLYTTRHHAQGHGVCCPFLEELHDRSRLGSA